MIKILSLLALVLITSHSFSQVIGRVNKKTKEFTVAANQKIDYRVFGYQLGDTTSRKMILFSTHDDVKENYNKCPLGSYFDTDKMTQGDKIIYLGPYGPFGKMQYVTWDGKKTIFFMKKTAFEIK